MKKYKLINSKKQTEFEVSVESGEYVMTRSDQSFWTNPGEEVLKAVDDGNGILIGETHYDYSDISELYHLLRTMVKSDKKLLEKLKIKK